MYKLSPSDFAFLYQECKYCYVRKVKEGIQRPSMPMPGVFSALNSIIQGNLIGKSLTEISEDLPAGKVIKQEGFVKSVPVPNTNVYISGKYDLLIKNDDSTYTLVDLKISKPGEDKGEKYKTQLSAYKFAMENPKEEDPIKISKMGLLIFYPEKVGYKNGTAYLAFPPKWIEVEADEKGFLSFAKEISDLLDGSMPKEAEDCKWCQYRHIDDTLKQPEDGDLPF